MELIGHNDHRTYSGLRVNVTLPLHQDKYVIGFNGTIYIRSKLLLPYKNIYYGINHMDNSTRNTSRSNVMKSIYIQTLHLHVTLQQD